MHPSSFPSKFWFLLIVLSFFLNFSPNCVFANSFMSCRVRTSCGSISYIGYPFWGWDRPESCGYPGFQLNCNQNMLEITIMSATYRVLEINNSTQTLVVARTDYSDSLCPTRFINSTFDTSPFRYNETTRDIRLYYDCPSPAGLENLTSFQDVSDQFECTINGASTRGYYVTTDFTGTAIGNFFGFCWNSVIIPVPISRVPLLVDNRDSDALEEAVRVGFGLRWSANDSRCNTCLNDGGQCGRNLNSNEFACYNCTDGDVCSTSSPAGKSSLFFMPGEISLVGFVDMEFPPFQFQFQFRVRHGCSLFGVRPNKLRVGRS
ncbi:hypothetical protein HRI_001370200 [Hibiscus trionum]|uniref:non-specific serine/threonine protein kinase n=1 Tax=Hibiscus trionum TaxID=183268 RepID=A0A9W7HGC8_HIBTR|nr:hypothetical protein HRI_001370200 [Hibiscus trionum]